MDINDLPKEVRELLEGLKNSGADVKVIAVKGAPDDVDDEAQSRLKRAAKGTLTLDDKLSTLFDSLDHFAGKDVKVLLGDSKFTPREVWDYLSKHGYTEETLTLLTAASMYSGFISFLRSEGFFLALTVMEDAYSNARKLVDTIVELHKDIDKNRSAMLKLLADGGFYEVGS